MWDLPGLELEPVSPTLAGGFLTTAPPGKSLELGLKGNHGHGLIERSWTMSWVTCRRSRGLEPGRSKVWRWPWQWLGCSSWPGNTSGRISTSFGGLFYIGRVLGRTACSGEPVIAVNGSTDPIVPLLEFPMDSKHWTYQRPLLWHVPRCSGLILKI